MVKLVIISSQQTRAHKSSLSFPLTREFAVTGTWYLADIFNFLLWGNRSFSHSLAEIERHVSVVEDAQTTKESDAFPFAAEGAVVQHAVAPGTEIPAVFEAAVTDAAVVGLLQRGANQKRGVGAGGIRSTSDLTITFPRLSEDAVVVARAPLRPRRHRALTATNGQGKMQGHLFLTFYIHAFL